MVTYNKQNPTPQGPWLQDFIPVMDQGIKDCADEINTNTATLNANAATHTAEAPVSSVSTLKNKTGVPNGTVVRLLGYTNIGDDGGGLVRRNTALSSTNEGTTYDHNTEAGGWERIDKGPINVKWFGARGDSTVDDGPAINAAIADACRNAADARRAVYFPFGEYYVATQLVVPTNGPLNGYVHIFGESKKVEIKWDGTATYMMDLVSKLFVHFSHLTFRCLQASSSLFHISASFHIDFTTVDCFGTHNSDGVTARPNQRAFVLDGNSGDSHLVQCKIFKFGVGVESWCIQNYLTSCDVLECRIGILGKEGGGLSVTNTTIAGGHQSNSATMFPYGVLIDNAGVFMNQWWFTNTWVEAYNVGVQLGLAASNNAFYMFKWDGGQISGWKASIKIMGGQQISFSNITMLPQQDYFTDSTYKWIDITTTQNPTGCFWNCAVDTGGWAQAVGQSPIYRRINSTDVPATGWVVF